MEICSNGGRGGRVERSVRRGGRRIVEGNRYIERAKTRRVRLHLCIIPHLSSPLRVILADLIPHRQLGLIIYQYFSSVYSVSLPWHFPRSAFFLEWGREREQGRGVDIHFNPLASFSSVFVLFTVSYFPLFTITLGSPRYCNAFFHCSHILFTCTAAPLNELYVPWR